MNCKIGNYNTGNWSTGNWNTGNWNTGNYNAGHYNIGHYNTGNWNTGDNNTGYWNAGHNNTGDWNAGHYNTGHYNTGNWNTGNRNTGYCNTITPQECYIFNKPSKIECWYNSDIPEWMKVNLTKWVTEEDMTDKEKKSYPTYVTTGGYLKVYSSLKKAYVEAWEKTTQADRELTLKLPNYDPIVATEIFGFNPSDCVEQKKDIEQKQFDEIIEINGKRYIKIEDLEEFISNIESK